MKTAGLVIVLRGPEILLASNRRYGGWTLPGGKSNPGEQAFQAAMRELREETSLIVSRRALEVIVMAPGSVEQDVLVCIFFARRVYRKAFPNEPGTAIMWAPHQTLFEDATFGSFYREHFPKGFGHLPDTEIHR